MLQNLGLVFAFVSILLGAVLLDDGIPKADVSQSLRVISGAALVSLGLTTISLVVRSKLQSRRNYKKYREQ